MAGRALRVAVVGGIALATVVLGEIGEVKAQTCPEPGLQMVLDMTTGRQFLSSTQFMAQPNWVPFMHPASPILAFLYLPGWQAVPLQEMSAVGVLLRSPDGTAALQIHATPPSGAVTSQQAAEMSLQSLLGQGGQMQLLCAQDFQVPGVYPQTVSFLGATDGRSVGAAVAQVIHDPGNGAPVWVDTRSVAAPAQLFDLALQRVFLPIFAQLQMQGGGGGGGEPEAPPDEGEGEGEGEG